MAQITTIVVPDAAATPVNHTFSKVKSSGDSVILVMKSLVSAVSNWPLVLAMKTPLANQTEKLYRTKLTLNVPVVVSETINGVTRETSIGNCRANVEFVCSEQASLQNRKDLRKLVVGVIDSASFKSSMEDQEGFW